MWNIKVNVSQDHIDNACQRDSHHCMVADAVHDRLKWATFVMVDAQSIRFNNRKEGKRYIFLTPPEAQKAIVMFDQGVKVKPFAFTLNQGFMRVQTMRARRKDANKNKRTTAARRKRRATGAARKVPVLSIQREFGLRRMVR